MLSQQTETSSSKASEHIVMADEETDWDSNADPVRDLMLTALAQAVGEELSTISPDNSLYALGLDSLDKGFTMQTFHALSDSGALNGISN
ncbi:hypothetical protein N7468_002738 [Penicillium chermesinum]|uniref:Carrier domain-containing protein n=1 Tax=Penicillium chermesinum TaxID=63820 RepID=A0A9W9PJ69_9EURO|nr:uncharacterized protein N7468_002738 [Penicillium chermesinum]KAJ5247755.1 hypothetical protein N7468_002738 [Penicillium chermesinum]KAJ6151519.1 hypothetical protein N7470_007116 [Penicillium chermesinum]